MANVTYTGPETILSHTCPSGSGKRYVFQGGKSVNVTAMVDVQHYLTSGGFKVELTPAEKAELKIEDSINVVEKFGDQAANMAARIVDKVTKKESKKDKGRR